MTRNMGAFDRGLRAFVVAPAAIVGPADRRRGHGGRDRPLCCRGDHADHSRHRVLPELHAAWDLHRPAVASRRPSPPRRPCVADRSRDRATGEARDAALNNATRSSPRSARPSAATAGPASSTTSRRAVRPDSPKASSPTLSPRLELCAMRRSCCSRRGTTSSSDVALLQSRRRQPPSCGRTFSWPLGRAWAPTRTRCLLATSRAPSSSAGEVAAAVKMAGYVQKRTSEMTADKATHAVHELRGVAAG